MKFSIKTKGHYDFIDITDKVISFVEKSNIKDGIVVIFIPGSTVGLTLLEHEEGLIQDLKEVFEKIAPENKDYFHHKKWGDRNGAAHIKSALIKPSLSIPIEDNKLCLGTWQNIIVIDFDERPREREIIIKIINSK